MISLLTYTQQFPLAMARIGCDIGLFELLTKSSEPLTTTQLAKEMKLALNLTGMSCIILS
jgi:hypothetical protein